MNDSSDEKRLSVWDHLDDLRRVLFRCVVALGVTSTLTFVFSDWLLRWLMRPYERGLADALLKGGAPVLQTLYPSETFMLSFKIALVAGIVLALPVLLHQLWSFVAPGLKNQEKKALLPALFAGTGLFVVGALFAFYLVVPMALHFFWEYGTRMGVQTSWTVSHYIGFVLMFLLAFGAAFELPLVVVLLTVFGILEPATIAARRPYVIVGIFVVAAILTPPDVVSQISLALPMWVLFEGSLAVSQFLVRKKT